MEHTAVQRQHQVYERKHRPRSRYTSGVRTWRRYRRAISSKQLLQRRLPKRVKKPWCLYTKIPKLSFDEPSPALQLQKPPKQSQEMWGNAREHNLQLKARHHRTRSRARRQLQTTPKTQDLMNKCRGGQKSNPWVQSVYT
eukprot:6492384-Amphidinium_carterae.19